MDEQPHWKSKTFPITYATVYDIAKEVDRINGDKNTFVVATMWQPVNGVDGMPMKDKEGMQVYDAMIFYKVDPKSASQIKLPELKPILPPAIKMPVMATVTEEEVN